MPHKIVHVITGLSMGGAETMLLRLVEWLRGEFEHHVISLTNHGPIGDRISHLGVPIETLGLRWPFPNPVAISKLVWLIRRLRPTVVQTWMYHSDLLGGFAARVAGAPSVVWNLRATDLQFEKPLTRILQRQINARLARALPDVIVCCGERVRAVHLAMGYPAEKMCVIHNGIDVQRFSPNPALRRTMRTTLGIPPDAPVVGAVGRVHPMKDYGTFFATAASLSERLPQVRFVLAGKDLSLDKPLVAQWMEKTGLIDRVHFLGVRDDLPMVYNALDVFVSSSSSAEGFSNVVGEAMACGVPCVATDVGDSALIIGNTGHIVSPQSPAQLENAVARLLLMSKAEWARRGIEARRRVCQHFSIEKVVQQYANLYRNPNGE